MKPAKDVFQDLARNWILEYKRCDILAFVELPDDSCDFIPRGLQDDTPSWVPDWTIRRVSWPLLATWVLLSGDGDIDLKADDIEW